MCRLLFRHSEHGGAVAKRKHRLPVSFLRKSAYDRQPEFVAVRRQPRIVHHNYFFTGTLINENLRFLFDAGGFSFNGLRR